MPKVNRSKYAVLGMLSFAPMSGYDMKKRFDSSIAHFWNENYGRIYPVLKDLEAEGLVTKKTETIAGKPPRNVYSITGKGNRDLKAWVMLPAERPTLRIELLLKLFFGSQVPKENITQKLESEKAFCMTTLNMYSEIEEHVKCVHEDGEKPEIPFWLITLSYGKHYYRAVSEWCDETLKILRESREGGRK